MYTKIIILIIIFVSALNVRSQDSQLYPVKSGVLKYKFEGRTQGVEIIYFNDFGKLLSIKKTTFLISDGNTVEETVHSVYRNDTLFEVNMHNNTVFVHKIDNQTIKNKLISNEMLQALGYDKLGNENIAGVNCVKYSGKNGKLWVWNNIVLKSEMEIMDIIISSEATLVMTDIVIPPSKFEISKNYKIIN